METVLITGSSRGLGEALSFSFKERGYRVIDNNRTTGNLLDPEMISILGYQACREGVGILVNNAGVYLNKPFDQMIEHEIEAVIRTNLIAPFLLTKAVWPSFKDLGGGMVVNINSLAGLFGGNGETVYAASKHGLTGFSKTLQFDGTRDNVRVLNLTVGAMRTDMSMNRPDWNKFIDPFELAELVVSLCKERKTLRITDITVARRVY